MEAKNRLIPATVNSELEQVRDYSFFQLNALLREYCGIYNKTNDQALSLRYRALASLGFPAADIDSGAWVEEANQEFIELTVSFMGLYGPASPLPAYYTERVIQSTDPRHPSRDLMDLFNHRLISLLQSCWDKYRYYIHYDVGGDDHFSSWLLSLAGVQKTLLKDQSTLKWQRLLPYAGLLAKSSGSADLVKKIVSNYFDIPRVDVEPWIRRVMNVPSNQCSQVGMMNASLGEDLIMGDSVQDCNSKFLLHLYDLSPEQYRSFLPRGSSFDELVDLVKYLLKGAFDFDLCLHRGTVSDDDGCSGVKNDDELGWSLCLGGHESASSQEPARICVSDYQSI